jgi:uncharacterized protein (TIGR02246 family)
MAVLTPDLTAELEIRNLTEAYSDAVNRRASGDLAACFTEDGVWVVPGVPDSVGHEAIAAQLDQLLAGFEFLMQLPHGAVIRVDGDEATARWSLTEMARDTSEQGWLFAGVYHDALVRVGSVWRFRKRRFDFMYRGRVDMPGRAYPFPDVPPEQWQ